MTWRIFRKSAATTVTAMMDVRLAAIIATSPSCGRDQSCFVLLRGDSKMACQRNSTCVIECTGTCEIDCTARDSNCDVRCPNGQCKLECSTSSNSNGVCGFTDCNNLDDSCGDGKFWLQR